ncbi:MAG: hypothetical protein J2P25_20660 [Nocardiopsaceae bacterium]|nr:hypothetical protein [Nocardiopsaceae bacterium]
MDPRQAREASTGHHQAREARLRVREASTDPRRAKAGSTGHRRVRAGSTDPRQAREASTGHHQAKVDNMDPRQARADSSRDRGVLFRERPGAVRSTSPLAGPAGEARVWAAP